MREQNTQQKNDQTIDGLNELEQAIMSDLEKEAGDDLNDTSGKTDEISAENRDNTNIQQQVTNANEQTNTSSTNETAQVQNQGEKITTQTTVKPAEKKLSIWSQIGKPTEEDKNLKQQASQGKTVTEEPNDIASNLAAQASQGTGTDEENDRREGNKVKAAIIVEICDVIFMLLCLVITWDFSKENQAAYTLHKDRKKAIQDNMFKIFQMSNKKPEPKKQLWLLVLGSYLPMLLVAILTLIKKLQDRQKEKKQAQEVDEITLRHQEQAKENATLLADVQRQNATLIAEVERLKAGKPTEKNPITTFNKSTSKNNRGVKPGTKRGSYKKNK